MLPQPAAIRRGGIPCCNTNTRVRKQDTIKELNQLVLWLCAARATRAAYLVGLVNVITV